MEKDKQPEDIAGSMRKPGTHCAICGRKFEGRAYPGADVYCEPCIMDATKDLRERNRNHPRAIKEK